MKKLLALVMVLLLPLTAFSDGPSSFSDALFTLEASAFAVQCESALAGTSLAGSTVAVRENGEIALARDEYDAFAVMYRPDGLMMLCHFVPDGEGLALNWHNDLLLSYGQDIALSTEGAAWSGGSIPRMEVSYDTIWLTLEQGDGTRLTLKCEGFMHYEAWRVTEMTLYVSTGDERCRAALVLPEDCLAEDIYLATCMPNDWRRGETEEENQYGW